MVISLAPCGVSNFIKSIFYQAIKNCKKINNKKYPQQYWHSTMLFILDPTNAFQKSEFDFSLISYFYLDFQKPR